VIGLITKTKRKPKFDKKYTYKNLIKCYKYPEINSVLLNFVNEYGYIDWNIMEENERVKLIMNYMENEGYSKL
jgi:hypothetical protein